MFCCNGLLARQSIDTERMRVGEVQYFIKHSIKFKACIGSNLHETEHHLFAYVEWKKIHQHYNWCGVSATICSDIIEDPIAVQRIGARCAFAPLAMNFQTQQETACPIPLKYSI